MHREDAVTVSYTEISVFGNRARMEYVGGAPCSSKASRYHLQAPPTETETGSYQLQTDDQHAAGLASNLELSRAKPQFAQRAPCQICGGI